MPLTPHDIDHIFQRLRMGAVPERGLDAFAVGIEPQRDEMGRMLDHVAHGEGEVKFLRGGYGCGKTFMSRLTQLDAQRKGFVTSFVVVSDNDLHFHRFDDVYRRVVGELATQLCPRGALGDLLDRWIGRVEEALVAGGADDEADDFDARVQARLREELISKTQDKVPQDFIRVLLRIFELKQAGAAAEAGSLISWLSGSSNVGAAAKRGAGIKGDVSSSDALAYLHGILAICKSAGYRGLVIVIDEVETILRMPRNIRGKSLNGIRQILDMAGQYPGLLWVFTGTPEFFDTRRGVAGLEPLHDRIQFTQTGSFASLRQAQLQLKTFDGPRLRQVAQRLRGLAPHAHDRIAEKVSDEFIDRLVADVTAGFAGDTGVVPRKFLRKLVQIFDVVEQEPSFEPMTDLGFEQDADGPEGVAPPSPDDDGEEGYEPVTLDW